MPIVKCENCGKEFKTSEKRFKENKHHYCSRECCDIGKRKKIVTTCSYCHKEIMKAPSQIRKTNFCCFECYTKFRKKEELKTNAICENCGKHFKKNTNHLKTSKHNFCSYKCFLDNNKNKKLKTKCNFCKKTIYVNPSRIKEGRKYFCDAECCNKYRAQQKEKNTNKTLKRIRSYQKSYYHSHPNIKEKRKCVYKTSEFREKNAERTLKYRNNNIEILKKHNLITDCIICGFPKEKFIALDFHHIDASTKKYNISTKFRSMPNILSHKKYTDELKKCVCLCANCHRLLHNNDEETLEKYKKFLSERLKYENEDRKDGDINVSVATISKIDS